MQGGPLAPGLSDAPGSSFGNTDWFVVRQAGRLCEPQSDAARSRLCELYWKPVFRRVLLSGVSWHDAEDLTQEFFARVLDRNSFQTASIEKGKFRSFVVTLLKRFLADKRDRNQCQKRGGRARIISLDEGDTEFRRRIEPADKVDPEILCERRAVESLVQDALMRLEKEWMASGKGVAFKRLAALITGESGCPYAKAAAVLHTTEGNLRVTVFRLRRRLRDLLREALDQRAGLLNVKQELLGAYR
ncbi:MAG TPA: ECF-type sigma factor [Verrucomicrobiae bacterium]|nr:ECF-type sigma factor [Verrucomicrobiae bacterium]